MMIRVPLDITPLVDAAIDAASVPYVRFVEALAIAGRISLEERAALEAEVRTARAELVDTVLAKLATAPPGEAASEGIIPE